MGGKRLKKKDELNYRRGGTAHQCGQCNHYVPDFRVKGIGGVDLGEKPRCKIIGLGNSVLYQVNEKAICDEYNNSEALKRLGVTRNEKGELLLNGRLI